MAKPVEPIMTGALLLKGGEDMLIRGTPNILFHFNEPDISFLSFDETKNTLMAGIPTSDDFKGATCNYGLDSFRLRYVVRPRGAGDILEVTYTLIDESRV